MRTLPTPRDAEIPGGIRRPQPAYYLAILRSNLEASERAPPPRFRPPTKGIRFPRSPPVPVVKKARESFIGLLFILVQAAPLATADDNCIWLDYDCIPPDELKREAVHQVGGAVTTVGQEREKVQRTAGGVGAAVASELQRQTDAGAGAVAGAGRELEAARSEGRSPAPPQTSTVEGLLRASSPTREPAPTMPPPLDPGAEPTPTPDPPAEVPDLPPPRVPVPAISLEAMAIAGLPEPEADAGKSSTAPPRAYPVSLLSATSTRTPPPSPLSVAGAVIVVAGSGIVYLHALFLYSRLVRQSVAREGVRRRILEHVLDHPGSTPTDVARALGVHPTTATHHLRVLTRFGYVVDLAEKDNRWYFGNHGLYPKELRRSLAAFQRPQARSFLEEIVKEQGLRLADLARRLGIPVSTAGYRARILVQFGLLQRLPRGWSVTPRAKAFLVEQDRGGVPCPAIASRTRLATVGSQ